MQHVRPPENPSKETIVRNAYSKNKPRRRSQLYYNASTRLRETQMANPSLLFKPNVASVKPSLPSGRNPASLGWVQTTCLRNRRTIFFHSLLSLRLLSFSLPSLVLITELCLLSRWVLVLALAILSQQSSLWRGSGRNSSTPQANSRAFPMSMNYY